MKISFVTGQGHTICRSLLANQLS